MKEPTPPAMAADALRLRLLQKARYDNDLSVLLRPWFTYRLHVRFLMPYYDPRSGVRKDTTHFYGNEHSVSYNQCKHGHAPVINLDKLKGYEACIAMAEKTFKGKYYHATIYARTDFPDGKFTTICRHYDRAGELKEVQDPVIEVQHNRVLYHQKTMGDFLEICSEKPIDFKTELVTHLK